MSSLPDIYFTPEYGKAYENHENGKLDVFEYKDEVGQISCQFIRRKLIQFEGYEDYSDIITPYGYGGPLILECTNELIRNNLVERFYKSFYEYCMDEKIVSFFIRFHPLLYNANDFIKTFDQVHAIRKIIVMDLSKDLFYEEIDRKARQNFNKAVKMNMVYEHDPECNLLETFYEMYTKTMEKNQASDYYYFPREYFANLKKLLGNSLELHVGKLEGQVVCLMLTFCYGDYVHLHLTASTREGYKSFANEFVKINCALKCSQRGFKWMIIGGGVSNDPEDSLYLFKKKFSKTDPYDFYIGKNVFNQQVYNQLSKVAEKQRTELSQDFFPLYRAPL